MVKKKIWIINYYSSPPEYEANPRHLEFSHFLNQSGYDVTIFSSGYLRDKNINLVPKGKKYINIVYDGYKYVHIKVKKYSGNGIDRILSIIQFAFRIFLYCKKFEKPDIILHNIHAPFDYPIIWCAKRLNAKYIVEAWDLWPESFVLFGLIQKSNPFVRMSYLIERRLYEKSDKIIFTFEGGIDYLNNKKWTTKFGGKIDTKKISYINNGVNISKFNSDAYDNKINDTDINDTSTFKVIYLGSIRMVNNIKQLIDAANLLRSFSNIKFLIYGDGEERDNLELYCAEKRIDNVIFKEKWIPFKNIPYILTRGNLNILNYQHNFGIYGISSGKFFQYLASGKPICSNVKINYCQIEKFNLGIAKNFKDSKEYADAIHYLATLSKQDYSDMCLRVKSIAEKYDYEVLSTKLMDVIDDLCQNNI